MSVETYKRIHKPILNEKYSKKPKQGYYIPQNKEKVIGNINQLIFRSGWESSFCRWCDINPNVLKWGIEIVQISYRDPGGLNFDQVKQFHLDAANPLNWPVRNYYIDFYVELKENTKDNIDNAENKVSKMIIEIKPKSQTENPIPPDNSSKLKDQRRFVNAAKTFLTNEAKWKAAKKWADEHDMTFCIFTENTLNKLGIL